MNAPIDVTPTAADEALIDSLPEVFDRDFIALVKRCPECNAFIVVLDNGVWLDAKSLPAGHDNPCAMGIMKLGALRLAVGGNIQDGSAHNIHDHQPDEE